MSKKLCPLLLFFLLAGSLVLVLPGVCQEFITPDYFPMGVGYRWTYKIREINKDLTVFVSGTEKVNGYTCYQVQMERSDGMKFGTELITKTENSVLSLGSENTTTLQKKLFKKPAILLSLPLTSGKTWVSREPADYKGFTSTVSVVRQERIQVPAGIFYAFYLVEESRREKDIVLTHRWLAPGVGTVQWIIEAKGQKAHFFLTRYSFE